MTSAVVWDLHSFGILHHIKSKMSSVLIVHRLFLRNSVVSACHLGSWYTCKCNFIYANKKGTAFCVSIIVTVLIFTKIMLAWKISLTNSWTKFQTNGIVTDTRSQTDAMTDWQTRSSIKANFLVLIKNAQYKSFTFQSQSQQRSQYESCINEKTGKKSPTFYYKLKHI